MRRVLETAVALAVSGDVRRGLFANRHRRGAPERSTVLVAYVDHLARPVADGVVRPRGELVLAAVDRPRVASALDRHLEAERGVGDDVDPGRRCPLPLAEDGHVFPSAGGEAAEAVEELEFRSRWRGLRQRRSLTSPGPLVGNEGRRHASRRRGGGLRFLHTFELLGEAAAAAEKHRSCRGLEQGTHLDRNQVRAQDEHGSPCAFSLRARPRLARPHQCLQGGLEILSVGRGPFVQDHEIDGQLLHPPVFVGAEQLPDDLQILDLIDPHQDDRQVAGDAVRPERRLSPLASSEHSG